ncbi:MAG: rRNA maturation RNase YbeY [Thiohalophilus sp.]|uniref:rRNA maturation RNase YbeY n=1 Tax=Thiohalophilus sp. TaxID=3028392 RepID=UPI0028708F8A|nr:rRNA maturation RNase YbeY [Thiohalophilus sp.]MDR9435958.1 rRNA maturation RNase YbeY [Thiohalophilus sp.]
MSIEVEVQRIAATGPGDADIHRWVSAALRAEKRKNAELTVRIVDEAESAELNEQYRHKSGPTNVLSFPFECPPEVELNLLGDLVISAPVVQREAKEQGKQETAHWAHMVVHGTLHLLGYDHLQQDEAEAMERREISIMEELGYTNPYRLEEAQ